MIQHGVYHKNMRIMSKIVVVHVQLIHQFVYLNLYTSLDWQMVLRGICLWMMRRQDQQALHYKTFGLQQVK